MSSTHSSDQTRAADLLFLAKWESGTVSSPSDFFRARQIRRANPAPPMDAPMAAPAEAPFPP
jgi:hypothetical protein